MKQLIDNILVFGHHNPDTDASAASCAYAAYLNKIGRYDKEVAGAVPGPLTPQAEYVFDRAKMTKPVVIDDIYPRVGHVLTREAKALELCDRVGLAVEWLIRSDFSMLPVLDEEHHLHGIFSHRNDSSRFLLGFDPTPLWGTLLSIDDLMDMPGMETTGSVEPVNYEDGELRIAIDGENSWRESIHPHDVIICGSTCILDKIPGEQLPSCLVVLNSRVEFGDRGVKRMNENGKAVLSYEHSLPELLRGLTLHIRLGSMSLPKASCVGEFDRLDDIQSLLENAHHALAVVSESGEFRGVVSRNDLQRPDRTQIILVDHFEQPQAVAGIETAEVLEILDHHRVGDIQTGSPIRVHCQPVGSSCTIVANIYFDTNTEMEPGIAVLLLGGIVADTLVLTGPTTTDIDRETAKRLADIAGVDLQQFGTDVLVAGDDLGTSEPADIWRRDQKEFSIRNQNFAVAQLETASLDHLSKDKLEAFSELVQNDRQKNGRMLSLIVLTDVIKRDSWIFSSESDQVMGITRDTFSIDEPRPGWIEARGIVSRKKQIVPPLMDALSKA